MWWMTVVSLGRNDLNTLDVTIFRQTGIDENVRPLIGCLGLHNEVLGQRHDEIRLADLPCLSVGKLRAAAACRRDFPAALRRPPTSTMVAISSSVSDRSLLKCWMPTFLSMNHGGISRSDDLLLDRPCPGPRLLVRQQRHRRDAPRPMADLAVLLEDGRDVFRERDLGLPCHRLPGLHRDGGHHDDHSERHRKDEPHTSASLENSWPYSATSRQKEVRSLCWECRRGK